MSIRTADIGRSVEFYEALGFTQASTTDAWPHPYGVLTDGRLFLGLHQRRMESPTLTFVRPGIAEALDEFARVGIELAVCHTGEDIFNEIAFRDPLGQMISVLEARTYSPVRRPASAESLCGYFEELSMPAADFTAAKDFWEPLGFVATEETDSPYVHLCLTSDHLDIAFHRPRTSEVPLLVFREPDMPSRLERIRALGIETGTGLPRGLNSASNGLIEAPDGTVLLLLHGQE